jgi:integrase
MTQAFLLADGGLPLSDVSGHELEAFRTWRSHSGLAASTLAAEVSQLRSLARNAEQVSGLTLGDLRQHPGEAAQLIEAASASLGRSTILTRIRAFQRFLMMGASPNLGRQKVEEFRAAFPQGRSRGWFDSGMSQPGRKSRRRMPGPTPGADAVEAILDAGAAMCRVDGAKAALTCFSGLEVLEILRLRWRDLTWHEEGSPYWQTKVRRHGHLTSVFIVGPGASALLQVCLASGLDKDAYVLRGRGGGPLSERAFRDSLKSICSAAGWPKATRVQLLSAFAVWLRKHGTDDHSIRLLLGRRHAATVDRLLLKHDQLAAQDAFDQASSP